MSGALVTRQPGDRAGQATLNLRQLTRRTMELRRRIQIFHCDLESSGLDSRYQALIGCSAFCGFFAHLFNRAIGGGEVHLPFPDPACDGDPQRNPAPADRSGDDARGRRGRSACAGTSKHRRVTGNPHGGFIVAAYSAAAGMLAAMIGWVVMDFRRLSAQLDLATRALEPQMAPSAIEI